MTYRRLFYVCFRGARSSRWWHLFTGRKLSHVFLVTAVTDTSSIMIDPTLGGIGIYGYQVSAAELAKGFMEKGNIVVPVDVNEVDMTRARWKFFRTCVGIAKDLLGINKWWIITPKQLFKEVSHG